LYRKYACKLKGWLIKENKRGIIKNNFFLEK